MRIQKSPLPDTAALRKLLCDRPDLILEGAKVVDCDAQGPTGVDIVLADEEGRPVLVDIVMDEQREVPTRVQEHLEWMEQSRRLFLRAYSRDGVVKAEDPVLVFVSSTFPRSVVAALATAAEGKVRLIRAEHFTVDGVCEIACSEVAVPSAPAVTPAAARRTTELAGAAARSFEIGIESAAVKALFALFKSGVDGLDGGIIARESNGGLLFEVQGRPLALVSVSPGSFTVSPGDPVANPIVVSDRVSLERALNAVVSLFVREGQGAASDDGNGGTDSLEQGLDVDLGRIWGGGVGRVERT